MARTEDHGSWDWRKRTLLLSWQKGGEKDIRENQAGSQKNSARLSNEPLTGRDKKNTGEGVPNTEKTVRGGHTLRVRVVRFAPKKEVAPNIPLKSKAPLQPKRGIVVRPR